jgi:hypothetical protein
MVGLNREGIIWDLLTIPNLLVSTVALVSKLSKCLDSPN